MPSWRDEYLASLHEAERNVPANRDLVETCSQLADRIAVLEAEKAARLASPETNPTKTPTTVPSSSPSPSNEPPASDASASARLRLDLAEALRSNGQLQSRLQAAEGELARLRAKTAGDEQTMRTLAAERRTLATRLRDRDDELRQKTKLVADVQDELAVLNLQLNVAERERSRAQEETRQLVDRWMRRMGQEADAMNLANEPDLARNR